MTKATKRLYNRLAVVFDFDDTLAPDTVSTLVERCGVPREEFWKERVQPLIHEQGWDPIPAAFYRLIELSREAEEPITRERLQRFGRELELFEGVPEMFAHLRERARELVDGIEVEFYLITSGVLEIARHTAVAEEFRQMWGCDFHYDHRGEIAFVKRVISHTEKTRYLYQISKGLDEQQDVGRPFEVNREISPEDLYIPLSQMVYVGDGFTDIPCFAVLNGDHGVAIGVYKESTAEKWGPESGVHRGERVENLAPADFRKNSELMRSLVLGVEYVCKQIALRQLSVGE